MEFFYPVLRKGDRIPSVAVLQKLLLRAGLALKVDGDFGSHTHDAVKEFQRQRGIESARGVGVTDQATWAQLTSPSDLPIIDAVDVFDPMIYRDDAKQIMGLGARPILIGGMSNGVVQTITMVRRQAQGLGNKLFLLRFNGHGSPGMQYIAAGGGSWREWKSGDTVLQAEQLMALNPRLTVDDLFGSKKSVFANGRAWTMVYHKMPSTIEHKHRKQIDQGGIIHTLVGKCIGKQTDLWAAFGDYGCVQLHGCNVGAGIEGRKLLHSLAEALMVPVSAAGASGKAGKQIMGQYLTFSGPVYTAFPNGSASAWYNSLPDFPPISVGR